MQVLVFKTNLRSRRHVSILEPVLAVHPYINQWNVDLQDRDKVLRIETEKLQEKEVEELVSGVGYFCEALT